MQSSAGGRSVGPGAPRRSVRCHQESESPQAQGHFPWLGGGWGRSKGRCGSGAFLSLRDPTPLLRSRIHYLRKCSVLRSRARQNGGWRYKTGELSSLQPPPRHAPPPHIASFLGSLHSLLHPPVPLVILAPSEKGARCWEGEAAARLTWPSLRWGRRPRLPGRPQLRLVPRGPGPSGRALRALSSSSPCGPGNSPGFWQRPRWHPDRPEGCLECRRPAWSRRSPGGGAAGEGCLVG